MLVLDGAEEEAHLVETANVSSMKLICREKTEKKRRQDRRSQSDVEVQLGKTLSTPQVQD